jgi:hypothetical protein
MTPDQLQAALAPQGGVLTVGSGTLPGAGLDALLLRYNGGQPVRISGATVQRAGNTVTATGKAPFQLVPECEVDATFTVDAKGTPTARFRFGLVGAAPAAGGWTFSRSFAALPPFADSSLDAGEHALLDSLTLSNAAFVLSTTGGTDTATGAVLEAGLGFAATLAPSGVSGLLDTVLGGTATVPLAGKIVLPLATDPAVPPPPVGAHPWDVKPAVAGIHLRAQLGITRTLGSLSLGGTELRIYTPPSATWYGANPGYPPTAAVTATFSAAATRTPVSLEMSALVVRDLAGLVFSGRFTGVTLGAVLGWVGSGKLLEAIPPAVRERATRLERLSLDELEVTLTALTPAGVESVMLGVGLPHAAWKPLDDLLKVTPERMYFYVADPLAATRSVDAVFTGTAGLFGADFDVTASLPHFTLRAELAAPADVKLRRVLSTFFPRADPPGDGLVVEEMWLGATPGVRYHLSARMAETPEWSLPLGPGMVTIESVSLELDRDMDGRASSAVFEGSLRIGDEIEIAARYEMPGDFLVRGTLPGVRLAQLVSELASTAPPLPGSFDLGFGSSEVLVRKAGAELELVLGTTTAGVGTAAFTARRVGSRWGVAAAVELDGTGLSSLPGLGALAAFESVFALDQLVLVLSSFDDPGFTFPSLAVFQAPTLPSRSLALPPGGVAAGLNVHARWTPGASNEQALLKRLLNLDPSLSVTLQVSADPRSDTRLYAQVATTFQGYALRGELGGRMRAGDLSLFMEATLAASIAGKPAVFDVTLAFVENGALLSGTMAGTVAYEGLTLSNLALVAGVDWEGVPSLGVAATLATGAFDSSLAVLFDSAEPSRSLLAGSVSGLSLKDVVDAFVSGTAGRRGQHAGRDRTVDHVLRRVELVGTAAFTLPAAAADALDPVDAAALSLAFAAQGATLPAQAAQLLVATREAGKRWSLTDLSTLTHYGLERTAAGVEVTLDPQLYLAPQATTLGTLQFPQGFSLSTGVKVHTFSGEATVEVSPTQGILVEGSMDRVVVGEEWLFSLSSADGQTGPRLSAATYTRPGVSDPVLRGPHFVADGRLRMLGLEQGLRVTADAGGFSFEANGSMAGVSGYTLEGSFGSGELRVKGTLQVEVDSLDLGPLGTVDPQAGAHVGLEVTLRRSELSADVHASLRFAGSVIRLDTGTVGVGEDFLLQLPARVAEAAEAALKQHLESAAAWARGVAQGLITGAGNVGTTLRTEFGLGADGAARALAAAGYGAAAAMGFLKNEWTLGAADVVGLLRDNRYTAADVAGALKSLYASGTDQVMALLRGAGYAAEQVGSALASAFGTTRDRALQMFRDAGYAAQEVAAMLKTAYAVEVDAVAGLLRGAGFPADQVGKALSEVYGAAAGKAAQLLKDAGYAVNDVAAALKGAYGTAAGETAQLLKGAGYVAGEVAGALKSAYGTAAGDAAQLLKDAGYTASEVAGALKSVFGTVALEAGRLLLAAGYGRDEVMAALRIVYGVVLNEGAKILKDLGFYVTEAGDALFAVFADGRFQGSLSVLRIALVAGALKLAGYPLDQMSSYLQALGVPLSALRDVLVQIGFPASEVDAFFDTINPENWIEYLNPVNW